MPNIKLSEREDVVNIFILSLFLKSQGKCKNCATMCQRCSKSDGDSVMVKQRVEPDAWE